MSSLLSFLKDLGFWHFKASSFPEKMAEAKTHFYTLLTSWSNLSLLHCVWPTLEQKFNQQDEFSERFEYWQFLIRYCAFQNVFIIQCHTNSKRLNWTSELLDYLLRAIIFVFYLGYGPMDRATKYLFII